MNHTNLLPLDAVLVLFLDEVDPFQDVGDVIDSPLLLDIQLVCSLFLTEDNIYTAAVVRDNIW